MADYLPKHNPGVQIPRTVGATAVIGGRLVEVGTSDNVIPAGADSVKVVGVAAQDAAVGERVTVFTRAGGVHPLVASGAIAAGALVGAAAAGKAKTAAATAGAAIGLALTSAAADNDVIDVLFI